MNNRTSIKNQLYQRLPTLIISFTVGISGIVVIYVLSIITGTPLSDLTRDPIAIYSTNVYIGILSNLGLFLWSATAAIYFFGFSLLVPHNRRCYACWFLLCFGLFSLAFTFDDAFLLHEQAIPNRLHIPEFLIFVGYVVAAILFLIYFIRLILTTDYLLLLIAAIFLGISAVADQFLPFGNGETFFEDSFKFIGIIFWHAYCAHTTYRMVHNMFAAKTEGG